MDIFQKKSEKFSRPPKLGARFPALHSVLTLICGLNGIVQTAKAWKVVPHVFVYGSKRGKDWRRWKGWKKDWEGRVGGRGGNVWGKGMESKWKKYISICQSCGLKFETQEEFFPWLIMQLSWKVGCLSVWMLAASAASYKNFVPWNYNIQ